MANLAEVLIEAAGTGIIAYGIAAGIDTITDQTLVDSFTAGKNIYIGAVAAGARTLYATLDAIVSPQYKK